MDQDLARHIVRIGFQTSRELGELLTLLRRHLSGEDYQRYAGPIAAAIDAVHLATTQPALALRPELAAEVEASLARYDRLL